MTLVRWAPVAKVVCSLALAGVIAPIAASDNKPNTLIAVNVAALSNDNRTVPGSLRYSYIEYRLYNEETKEVHKVEQRSRAKLIYLKPGDYCLHSTRQGQYRILRVANTGCFRVVENVINNAGTWIVGIRANPSAPNSLLIGMKENYAELESFVGLDDSQPSDLSLPPQLIQARDPEDANPLGT